MRSIDESANKLHPKLRMISNGSDRVNGVRAELSSIVVSTIKPEELTPSSQVASELVEPEMLRAPGNEAAFSDKIPHSKRKKLTKKSAARSAFVNVFIEVHRERTGPSKSDGLQRVETLSDQLRRKLNGAKGSAEIDGCVLPRRSMISATVPVALLDELKHDPRIAFVQPAEALTFRIPTPLTTATGQTGPIPRKVGNVNLHGDGDGIIIGIIDVGGFDFAHPGFSRREWARRASSRIWDQGGQLHSPPDAF